AMHRLCDRAAIEKLVERIRTRVPGVTFRTAFIVGFPGETDQAFDELKTFVEQAQFDRVAVFGYSDEEGTPAFGLDSKVERTVMEERRTAILAVQETIAAAKGREKVGSVIEVLVDGPSEEQEWDLEGRHEGLAPEIDGVVYLGQADEESSASHTPMVRNGHLPTPGDIVTVRITDATTYDLVGEIVA
ncbi:MAG: TRAM domain-containing protein, partial [Nitrospira sp.]|nr:TRAM domain-containing protein [Nitrospira sp.]